MGADPFRIPLMVDDDDDDDGDDDEWMNEWTCEPKTRKLYRQVQGCTGAKYDRVGGQAGKQVSSETESREKVSSGPPRVNVNFCGGVGDDNHR